MRTTETIKQVLGENPRARHDEKYLLLKVWSEQGLHLSPGQADYIFSKQCSTPESVRRTRQKLQQNGQYRPLEVVYRARQRKAQGIRQAIAKMGDPMTLFEDF